MALTGNGAGGAGFEATGSGAGARGPGDTVSDFGTSEVGCT